MRELPQVYRDDRDQRGGLRILGESLVCLMLAVLMFRQFAAEGYMISTGSMAPHLYGFHKRVVCPRCHFPFAMGVAFDAEETAAQAPPQERTNCPHCGRTSIDVSEIPRNHGDQLLVDKQAFLRRWPQRWEVVVFRNPQRPDDAYVKRVVGLPGERIQIIEGDIYINGKLARKNAANQREMRILVNDSNFMQNHLEEGELEPQWQIMPRNSSSRNWVWNKELAEFRLKDLPSETAPADMAWLGFRQSAPWGGKVRLTHWPETIQTERIPPLGLKFDLRKQELSCTRPIPIEVRNDLVRMAPNDEEFISAIKQLYDESHYSPVTDRYGYNASEPYTEYLPIRDLQISARVHRHSGEGRIALELNEGHRKFVCQTDFASNKIELWASDQDQPVKSSPLPAAFKNGPVTVELSIFDQQVVATVNGQELWESWHFETPAGTNPTKRPARIGATGLDLTVDEIKIYRDVYYTTNRSKHAGNNPFQLAEDEFFVLGDNSPLSHDSRRWDRPGVSASLLVGKPFLVHLPSKPGRLQWGNKSTEIRLPDWERVRFLR